MKDKVIKKQKPLPPIEKDEEPFEIPDSWEWVRLGDTSCIIRGGSPRPIKKYLTNDSDGINWIKIGDAEDGSKYIKKTKEKILKSGLSKTRFVNKGTFLLTNSMSFGKPYILQCDGAIHDGWLAIESYQNFFDRDFLYHLLSSNTIFNQFEKISSGSVVKNLNKEKVKNIIIPLPPLSEQQRIVSKIEELFAELDKIDKAQEKYDSAANKLREKVLDTAMRGKLVPQDPNDEPANELLKRIENEKQHLIKEKVIKKQRPLPPISKDEVPFEIPESWEWVRLGKVCRFIDYRGKTPKKINHGIRLLTAKNIKKGFLSLEPEEFISVDEHMERNTRGNVQKDSILFTTEAPLGNVAINPFDNVAIAQRTIAIDSYNKMTNYFLFYELLSPMIQISIKKTATGSTVKGIKAANLRNILILLPPLSEQQRIVSKIEEIFPLLKV